MSDSAPPADTPTSGAAYYAQPRLLTHPRAREWWTVLHPPYTAWHLSYVVIGACLAAPVNATTLWASVLAFFFAVGLGAHALDELQGRPLSTCIPTWQLITVAAFGVGVAIALGVVGLFRSSPYLLIFMAVGVVMVVGYNLELFGGRLHSNATFALGWGGFPLVTAGFAQHGRLTFAVVCGGVFATLLAQAQRQLSTPARDLRRLRLTHAI